MCLSSGSVSLVPGSSLILYSDGLHNITVKWYNTFWITNHIQFNCMYEQLHVIIMWICDDNYDMNFKWYMYMYFKIYDWPLRLSESVMTMMLWILNDLNTSGVAPVSWVICLDWSPPSSDWPVYYTLQLHLTHATKINKI